jgi:molybdopterin synthase catalytic subunit
MRVNVRLFAMARQRVGASTIAVELPRTATVADLKAALAGACPALEPLLAGSMIAVNHLYAADSEPIAFGADLAVIPPVSGGGPLHPDES